MTAAWAEFEKYEQDVFNKGAERGMERVLRRTVRDLCEVLGVPMGADRQALIEAMDQAQLSALWDHLKDRRAWPGT